MTQIVLNNNVWIEWRVVPKTVMQRFRFRFLLDYRPQYSYHIPYTPRNIVCLHGTFRYFSEKIGNKICNLRRKTPVSLLYCKVMRCYVACRWHAIIACWVASFYFKIFNQPQTRWVTKGVNNLPRTNSYINLDLYQHISSNVSRLSKF